MHRDTKLLVSGMSVVEKPVEVEVVKKLELTLRKRRFPGVLVKQFVDYVKSRSIHFTSTCRMLGGEVSARIVEASPPVVVGVEFTCTITKPEALRNVKSIVVKGSNEKSELHINVQHGLIVAPKVFELKCPTQLKQFVATCQTKVGVDIATSPSGRQRVVREGTIDFKEGRVEAKMESENIYVEGLKKLTMRNLIALKSHYKTLHISDELEVKDYEE